MPLLLIEKTPVKELAVNIVYMEGGETIVKQLSNEEIEEIPAWSMMPY